MKPIRICLAIDSYSQETLERSVPSIEMARRMTSDESIHLVHIRYPLVNNMDEIGQVGDMSWLGSRERLILLKQHFKESDEEKARHSEGKIAEFCEKRFGEDFQPRIEVVAAVGQSADKIIAHAESIDADMIFVASESLKGFSKIMLGSTAERLVKKSQIPVAVFPKLSS